MSILEKSDANSLLSSTGVPGLDPILGGGLPKNHLYLLQGKPGTGKTTLAMQFLLEGVRNGEKSLYITFSETKPELEAVAASHGWDISGITVLDLSVISANISPSANTLFHSSEVELENTIKLLMTKITEAKPNRVVFDSLSELRLLANSSLKYRRQILGFKEFFQGKKATVFLLDDMTTEAGDLHVQSVVHGVMLLEKFRAGYGAERREFHIAKLRGVAFKGGTHDYLINRGGIRIFPRLVALEHSDVEYKRERISSGNLQLDTLLGGGLDRGTSNLVLGPAGCGKSTLALRYALSAADQGLKVAIYNFEENISNLIERSVATGMDLRPHLESGAITLRKIDPAELSPGHFSSLVRTAVEDSADMIVIDSLNGYMHAMPEAEFLILQLHELLSYLGNRGVLSLLILAQSGVMGTMKSPLDLTYLADTVVLTRYFEAFGSIRKAISVLKKRSGAHENTLREFKVSPEGLVVGNVLSEFTGILTGIPQYAGSKASVLKEDRG